MAGTKIVQSVTITDEELGKITLTGQEADNFLLYLHTFGEEYGSSKMGIWIDISGDRTTENYPDGTQAWINFKCLCRVIKNPNTTEPVPDRECNDFCCIPPETTTP